MTPAELLERLCVLYEVENLAQLAKHLLLSLVTLGLWIPVWILLGLTQRERRKVIRVDASGNVTV